MEEHDARAFVLAASFRISASLRYMLAVSAFFLAGRFNPTRRMLPERS